LNFYDLEDSFFPMLSCILSGVPIACSKTRQGLEEEEVRYRLNTEEDAGGMPRRARQEGSAGLKL